MQGMRGDRVRRLVVMMTAVLPLTMSLISAATPAGADSGAGTPICIAGVCTIGVTAPGDPGSGGTGGGSGGGTSPTPPTVCTNTDPLHGCDPCPLDGTFPADPAACDAFSQNLFCSELNPAGTGASAATWESFLQLMNCAGNPYVIPDPAILAEQAAAEFDLSLPTIDRSPDATCVSTATPIPTRTWRPGFGPRRAAGWHRAGPSR